MFWSSSQRHILFLGILFIAIFAADRSASATSYTVTVTLAGTSTGTVTSSPAAISCKPTCSAAFASGTVVKLTAAAASGAYFAGWSGACTGTGACNLAINGNKAVTATFNPNQTVKVLNHIVFMLQENRGLDHYFGALREYWRANKYSDISFDGLPQFNPTSGAAPLYGAPPTNPGCDPNYPPPNDCKEDSNSPHVASFKLVTQCIENPSPSWNESHVDWNLSNPIASAPALNGYVYTAGHDSRNDKYHDVNGIRVMGYYDGADLNYYYYMATQFGTSDRWFSPEMSRTQPNRDYVMAATSQGYAYPIGTNANDQKLLTATTIFQRLQAAGISWKIYVNPKNTSCASNPTAACLLGHSYIQDFQWGHTIPTSYPTHLVPISQYFTDVANGTLPAVAMIESAGPAGLDEHGSDSDQYPIDIQLGAQYVASLINALMKSKSWNDSVFILTYDEAGGLYDHVAPRAEPSPDGIKPVDLLPGDICTGATGPNCNFVYTGYRVPLIVVSPYAKKHFVDHATADYTAILKLIETRFGLASLTQRDAHQPNMTEFFNFNFPPWKTPPIPPAQFTGGSCYLTQLP